MFNNKENDYFNAIKHAQVYASTETKLRNKKLLIANFLFLSLLGYMTFTCLENNSNSFSLPVLKQAVLGVSETIDDSELANKKFMEIINAKEVFVVENSMKVLSSKSSIQSKSSYTEAIARELDDKSGFKGRIAVVNQDIN